MTCAGTGCGVNHACACGVQLSRPRTRSAAPAERDQRQVFRWSRPSRGAHTPFPMLGARLSTALPLPCLRPDHSRSEVRRRTQGCILTGGAIDPGTTIWRRPNCIVEDLGLQKRRNHR